MDKLESIIQKAKEMGIPDNGNIQDLLLEYIERNKFADSRFPSLHNIAYIHYILTKKLQEKTLDEFYICFFNIHNFSIVNRKIGSDKGTKLLFDFFTGIQTLITDKAIEEEKGEFSITGGDSGIILFHKSDESRLIHYLSSTDFDIEVSPDNIEKVSITCHIGINKNPGILKSDFEILDSVTTALNVARSTEGSTVTVYDETIKNRIEQERLIEVWYKDALKNEEFEVYYQPKVDLHNYKLKGAEALVRWFHDGKMIFPDNFIPLLEKNYSIKYLDLYMLNHVCADVARWLSQGKEPIQISVNLSRASLSIQNIVGIICEIIDKYKVPRSLIQIELTESASITSNAELANVVTGLNHEGISTAMDDFGTGYSSLSLIKELPWDMLKIDKSLLHGAQQKGSRDQSMFKSIISMATDIGLECIVEGVQTRDDIRLLKESNCYLAQGFYFSKPIPKSNFEALLQNRKTNN